MGEWGEIRKLEKKREDIFLRRVELRKEFQPKEGVDSKDPSDSEEDESEESLLLRQLNRDILHL